MAMNEAVRKYVKIASRRPRIFDTLMLAIFGSEAEKFQKVAALVRGKTTFLITIVLH